MGLRITKYENGQDVTLGVSKFDYYYDDETFPTDSATDFENIILENGDIFFVTRQTDTTDGLGNVTNVSEAEFRIYAYISDITKKDRKVQDMGLAVPGNRIMYIKPSYSILSAGVVQNTDVVKEGDILTDRNDYQWRVIKIIHEPYLTATQIYKKAVIRSIGLEGSP